MDGDRKYKQRGYMDEGAYTSSSPLRDSLKPRGPKPPIDITGPRLPRMVESVTASRCYNCATPLPSDVEFHSGECPKCKVPLHCCKQCRYFEPATRFQCMKPVTERIPDKQGANACTFFKPRVTVARDSAPASNAARPGATGRPEAAAPKSATDARIAFDNLFKK